MADHPFSIISGSEGVADVIFVHGLTGSPTETWTSSGEEPEGSYWPIWLGSDLPHLNFYAVGYGASLFAKWAKKEQDLYERSKSTLDLMSSYGIGERPLVFVGHSLGGLLIKQMLRTALTSTEQAWNKIATSCCGVMFMATPHNGASLANLLSRFTKGFSSPHIETLRKDNPALLELNESFRSLCGRQQVEVTVFYEVFKTKGTALIVDRSSADPGLSGVMLIPVDADHVSICVPENRHSPVYRSVYSRLKRLLPPEASDGDDFSAPEDMSAASTLDRRDLQTKMIAAHRDHEYRLANEYQNKFARLFARSGLITPSRKLYNELLEDVEQRYHDLVYHPLICRNASHDEIALAVQDRVIEPLAKKYSDRSAAPSTIRNALYFLTERCHIRWDKP